MINLSIGDYTEGFEFITRSFIEKFSFPHKLWVVANLETCKFINWSMDGTFIFIDYISLNSYLNSARSIFKIKEADIFVQNLLDIDFVRRENPDTNGNNSVLMLFEHENFREKRLDLLEQLHNRYQSLVSKQDSFARHEEIKKKVHFNLTENFNIAKEYEEQVLAGRDVELDENRKFLLTQRMNGDLCFMLHGSVSEMQKSRWNMQALHQFRSAKILLQQKIKPNNDAGGLYMDEDNSIIELPSDMYENPYDSAMHMEVEIDKPDAVGYFGCADINSVKEFYGNLLPTFDHQQNCLVPQISLIKPSDGSGRGKFQIKIELKDGSVISTEELRGVENAALLNEDASASNSDLSNLIFDENITATTTSETVYLNENTIEYTSSCLPDLQF